MPDPGRRPRVLFVIGSPEPGGSEGQLVALLERLDRERIEPALLAVSPATDQRHTLTVTRLGLPFRVLDGTGPQPVRLARAAGTFTSVLRNFRPDLVYPWLEESALLAAPLARLARIPVLIARRNVSGPYALRSRPVVAAIHAAERLGVLATANSDAVADETVRRGIPRDRVRVIPNGHVVHPPQALPSAEVVVLGYLARMRVEKGHLRLIHALAQLDRSGAWRVDLGGDGPLRSEAEALTAHYGLTDRVRFLGAIDDSTAFWQTCDAGVLLSDHEGSPNALIEAAMLGRPLLGTAVGGIPEIIGSEGGLLAEPDDTEGIAAALQRLIADRSLRERLGRQARERAIERHSMDRFVDGQMAAIGEALELAAR